jgi:hypothetical protein
MKIRTLKSSNVTLVGIVRVMRFAHHLVKAITVTQQSVHSYTHGAILLLTGRT